LPNSDLDWIANFIWRIADDVLSLSNPPYGKSRKSHLERIARHRVSSISFSIPVYTLSMQLSSSHMTRSQDEANMEVVNLVIWSL
jgi:hypothetical protein